MGMRQPDRLSATPAYGYPGVAVADEHSRAMPSGVLPLLVLVIALAAATVWFVGLPALEGKPRAERTCEVIVLQSGLTKCVREPSRGSQGTTRKPTGRAQR